MIHHRRPTESGSAADPQAAETSEERSLFTEDRALLEWLGDTYQPEPMSFEQRAAFDRSLRIRLQSREPRSRWVAGALAACGLLAALWIALPRGDDESSDVDEARVATRTGTRTRDWVGEVLESDGYLDELYADDSSLLPDEYTVLASLLESDG
jgi:hypothetical protein